MKYLQVCQALYDYEARTTDEISIKENDTLYILAKEDDDWWKAELKQASTDGPATTGLVPATYMNEVSPIGKVQAEYDYEAQQEEELSFREGQTMWLLECDDPDWYLVKLDNGDIGLSPANYVHTVDQNHPPPTSTAPSVAPPMHTKQSANNNDDEAQSWTVYEYDASKKKKKKGKGNLMVGNAMLCYGSETDKASPVQQYPILSVAKYLLDGKNIHIEVEGPHPAVLDLQASSKSEAKAMLVKITESRKTAQAAGTHVSAMAIPSSSIPTTTANNIPSTTASKPRWALSLYTFDAEGGEEISITENQQILVTDYDRDDGWWRVETTDGSSGVIPSSYVQFYDSAGDNNNNNAEAVAHPTIGHGTEDVDSAAHDEVEAYMLAKERQQQEDFQQQQQQQQRKIDQQRRDEEERERRRKVQETAQLAEMTRQRQAEEDRRRRETVPRSLPSSKPTGTVGGSSNTRQDLPKPDPDRLRTWTDRSGTFKVEAQFLAYTDGKLRLHKANGVKIDVPLKKMSAEDIRWVERRTDQPVGSTMNSNVEKTPEMPPRPNPTAAHGSAVTTKATNSHWDWFDWLMMIGIPMQEALVYSSAFKADNLDDSDLTRLTHKQMKMLGMKEKHVQRMERYIDTGVVEPHLEDEDGPSTQTEVDRSKQIETDEEMARRLQKTWNDGTESSSKLKPSASAPKEPHPDLLDFLGSDLTSTSNNEQLQQPHANNDLLGFTDDAWAPRPSKETAGSQPQPHLQPRQAPPPPGNSNTQQPTLPSTSIPVFQQQPVSTQQGTSVSPQQQGQLNTAKTIDPSILRYQNPSSSPNGSSQQLNNDNTRPSLNQLSQQEELRKYQQQQRQQSLLEQQQQIIMQQQQHIQQQQIQQQQIQLQQQQGQLQQYPLATGYQQPSNASGLVLYNNGLSAPQQTQMTGYTHQQQTGMNNGLSSAAGQPMHYPPRHAPSLQPQATGRHWNESTPANPFGSPVTSQMTGVQFSVPDPSAFTQSPIQQPSGYLQQLQPQMTGIQQTELSGARDKYAAFRTPNADVFTPAGSMQYGQSGFPNRQG